MTTRLLSAQRDRVIPSPEIKLDVREGMPPLARSKPDIWFSGGPRDGRVQITFKSLNNGQLEQLLKISSDFGRIHGTN